MKNINKFSLIIGLIIAGVMSRIIPHLPNFTAVGATALFAGSMIKPKWLAYLLPLFILWLSDLFLNNGIYKTLYPEYYKGWVWSGSLWVYTGFVLITMLGSYYIQEIKIKSVLKASVSASMLFFLLTNFGVWINNPLWSQSFGGLMKCYTFALPFFWNTLAADLLFSGLIFGIYVYVREKGLIANKV